MGKIEERPGKVSFGKSFKDFWSGYVDFKGRSTRAGYWWMRLIMDLFWLVFFAIMLSMFLGKFLDIVPLKEFSDSSYVMSDATAKKIAELVLTMMAPLLIAGLVALVMFLPMLALRVRRYRDAGLRGRGQLALIGIYFVLSMFISVLTTNTSSPQALLDIQPAQILGFVANLLMFVLSLMPTGTLATDKETGAAAFFFKNKKFYEDNDGADELPPYQTPEQ